jgi:hypothetical protein
MCGLEPGDDPQSSGLPTAGGAEQGDYAPFPDVEAESVERDRVAERPGQIPCPYCQPIGRRAHITVKGGT